VEGWLRYPGVEEMSHSGSCFRCEGLSAVGGPLFIGWCLAELEGGV